MNITLPEIEAARKTVIAEAWRSDIFKQLHHRLTEGVDYGLTTRVRQLLVADLAKQGKTKNPSKAIHPSNVPPPAGESSAPKTAGKAKAPTSIAGAPAAKKTSKKDAGAAPSAPAQGTPASAGSAGKHWVGQHVCIKASKKIGEITAIREDGLLTVDITDRAKGVAWPFPQVAGVASCEVEVLEGQVRPEEQGNG